MFVHPKNETKKNNILAYAEQFLRIKINLGDFKKKNKYLKKILDKEINPINQLNLLDIEIFRAFFKKLIDETLKIKSKKTGQNTYKIYLTTATDADIFREDILTLLLNEDAQLYFLSMHSLKNGFKLKNGLYYLSIF